MSIYEDNSDYQENQLYSLVNTKKINKTKLFLKIKKENALFKECLEEREMEIEDVRSRLCDANKLINMLQSKNDSLHKKNKNYLNCINSWENWYENIKQLNGVGDL
jgi:hypothetical protein